jgi:glutathione S-transferase
LCDGVLDACLLIVYESRYRAPDKHEQSWIDRQADKVARGLSALDAAPPALDGNSGVLPHVGQIALACLLGYRDLRFDPSWRKTYPRLHAWHDDFAARIPAFAATKVER